MEKNRRQCVLLVVVVALLFSQIDCSSNPGISGKANKRVKENNAGLLLLQNDKQVVMGNGLVNLTLSVPDGLVTGISFNGLKNLLDLNQSVSNRGYYHVAWNYPESTVSPTRTVRDSDDDDVLVDKLYATDYKVIVNSETQIELSFTKTWNASMGHEVIPLNIDKRFVMLRGSSGFYTYSVYKRLRGYPDYDLQEARVVFRPDPKKFTYLAVTDDIQRPMPAYRDRNTGQILDYPEAVLLTNPVNPDFKGEVDDKYMYSKDDIDNKVHGWISHDPPVGFWMITPSDEFRTGGPLKQDLTAHAGPILLNMFMSCHYAGEDHSLQFRKGQPWRKVFGPVFVYFNSIDAAKYSPSLLWNDAKLRSSQEAAKWPYSFPLSPDFVKAGQRGAIKGQLMVHDRYNSAVPASFAYVGLALPGEPGSFQRENRGYQFWTKTDSSGNFKINNVIPRNYNLYAFVPGFIGDYKYNSEIIITPGSNIDLKQLVYVPPRNGPTIWEIGVPDRSAAEFHIPDPPKRFKIHKYKKPIEKFREYGLWMSYTDLYPKDDLVFTIGKSNYATDWFYAHVNRITGIHTWQPTTWQIVFNLDSVNSSGNYTFQIALASSSLARLQVRVNSPTATPVFATQNLIGKDNAIARHGIKGLYWLFSVGIPSQTLVKGSNTIFLTQSKNASAFNGVMYDYLRLEGPA